MTSAHKIDEALMLAATRETQGIPPDSVWQPGEDVRASTGCKPVKIEAGRFYRTRDGRKVGPMEVWSHVSRWDFRSEGYLWKKDGMNYDGPDSPHDIVAEWTDEPDLAARLEAVAVLKPCPFCGGAKVQPQKGIYTFIWCVDCCAASRAYLVEADAVAAWNRRVALAGSAGTVIAITGGEVLPDGQKQASFIWPEALGPLRVGFGVKFAIAPIEDGGATPLPKAEGGE